VETIVLLFEVAVLCTGAGKMLYVVIFWCWNRTAKCIFLWYSYRWPPTNSNVGYVAISRTFMQGQFCSAELLWVLTVGLSPVYCGIGNHFCNLAHRIVW